MRPYYNIGAILLKGIAVLAFLVASTGLRGLNQIPNPPIWN
jgi:hypothetical protein